MAFSHVTLAMDLSLSQPGFAVLALSDVDGEPKPIILEASHVKTNAKKPHGYRLEEISEEIDRLIIEYNPDHIVREKGFSRFPAVTQTLFKVVGVSDMVTYRQTELPVVEIAVTSVKKLVTGNGKASKKDVEEAVRRILRIDQADYFANDDESDAAAVGIAYYVKKGLLADVKVKGARN